VAIRNMASSTVYVPFMSDHAFALAAAMRSVGVQAEVLPPPNEESTAIGLDLCYGRECLPCFLCTGDIVRKCREPGFDTSSAVFLMPSGPGPCRFGQYSVLQTTILEEQGFGDAQIASPTSEDSYSMFSDDPVRLRKLSWQGLVAVDLLAKALHEHRPYEVVPGEADAAYRTCLDRVIQAIEAGGDRHLIEALGWTAEHFGAIRTDRSELRPLIGVIGEIYLVLNAFSNLDIVRTVEAAGGEVMLGTATDWLLFTDWWRKDLAWRLGQPAEFVKALLTDLYERRVEHRLFRALEPALRHPPETSVPEVMEGLEASYEPALGTEAVLTMGRMLDMAGHGVSGLVNVLPFGCMPGIIVATMAPKLRERMSGIPWLDVAYDGQQETNVRTRLEAFMHQAFHFHRRVVLA
jgi:predicted nucleotide-binding protein (sugar kinase/HSP70/actin superfamily)